MNESPSDPKDLGRVQARALLALVLINVLVAALLVLLAALLLSASRDALRERAQMAASNLAENLSLAVSAELGRVDMALQTLAAGTPADDAQLAHLRRGAPPIQSLRVITNGTAVLSAGEAAAWRWLQDPQAGEVFIGEPMPARAGHAASIGMARRLAPAAGGTQGLVYAEVGMAELQQMLTGFELGPHGAITLRHASMALIARRASGDDSEPRFGTRSISSQLTAALQTQPERGNFIARTALDGIERCSSYRRLARYPLLVIAGLGTEDYLIPWYQQRAQVSALLLFVMVLVATMSGLLFSAWRRQTEATRRLHIEGRRSLALLRTASDGIHVMDRDGRVVELSDSFAAMLGCSHDELLGQPASSWDAQQDPTRMRRWFQSFPVGASHRFETQHRHADGRLLDVEVSCAGLHIDGRDLIYCSARDISEHKRLEQQLAAVAQQVRDLYDQAPCGYHSLDAQGRYLHVNATELAWLGGPSEASLAQRHFWEFLTPASQQAFRRHFPTVVAGGRVDGIELELRGADGRQRWVSASATAVLDAQGRFLMSRTVIYDISELHQARELLRSVTQQQALMLDNDLIGIVKLRGLVATWTNQAMDRLFGYASQELIGQPLRALYADEDSYRQFVEDSATVLRGGGRYRRQIQAVRKDGRHIWIDLKGTLLPGDGEALESFWMLADITPIKESQQRAEHQAFHDPLTGLPNRLLLQDRLRQALALAERDQRRLAVCYVDLDGFKQVNDQHGHAAGDELLRQMAQRLLGSVRGNDTVCRLGGDEFVLLLNSLDSETEPLAALNRADAELARPVTLPDGQSVALSASIGVAFYPTDAQTPEQLLAHADRAMYRAKHDGRHCVRLYDALQA